MILRIESVLFNELQASTCNQEVKIHATCSERLTPAMSERFFTKLSSVNVDSRKLICALTIVRRDELDEVEPVDEGLWDPAKPGGRCPDVDDVER